MTNTGFNYASNNAQAAESLEIQGMFAKISGSRDPASNLNFGLVSKNDSVDLGMHSPI